MRVERRRAHLPVPPTDDIGNPALLQTLRAEIEARGPVTFARFMELALYDDQNGYYASSTERPSRAGDFLTAPEMHAIFGWVIARRLEAAWHAMERPATFFLREYGAGRGALVLSVLDGLRRTGSELLEVLRYQPVDLPGQVAEIETRLGEAGYSGVLDESPFGPIVGCVIANEFLDALPVHRVVMQSGRLREVMVDWQADRPAHVTGELSDPRLSAWFADAGVELADGQVAEVNLAMLDWIPDVARQLERGYVLVLDYGAGAADLYSERRATGTLRAFRSNHVSSDVLGGMGHQDITAHVDFDAFERAASASGLRVASRQRQAEFLLDNGLEQAYAAAREEADQEWDSALALRTTVRRLLDTGGMGGYTALTLAKGV